MKKVDHKVLYKIVISILNIELHKMYTPIGWFIYNNIYFGFQQTRNNNMENNYV